MTVAPRLLATTKAHASASAQVQELPARSPQHPLWLRFLLLLQHSSSAFACCTVLSALAVYGWTVYTPQRWNQEYQKLESLRRYERNLTTANETLKNELSQQAEKPETGLGAPKPERLIFLPTPASPESSSSIASEPSLPTDEASPPVFSSPLAY